MLTISKNNITNFYYTIKTMILSVFYFLIFCVMLKLLKVLTQQNLFETLHINSKYAIRDFREVAMVNAKKIKKRYYIFLVFYVFLFGPIIIFLLDEVVSSDFTHKYKTILFVIKLFLMNLPILLALIINNYIAKNVEK